MCLAVLRLRTRHDLWIAPYENVYDRIAQRPMPTQ